MNPYLSVGLVMCLISIIALVATSYMAVFFNRRAKADLAEALAPMALVVGGTADVDEAAVQGKYRGHIAEGRVAQMPGGMGRVFQSSVIDGAGGLKWLWTVSRSKDAGGDDELEFTGPDGDLKDKLIEPIQSVAVEPTLAGAWFKVEYDPDSGSLRLTRPMKTRRDIPGAEPFERYLTALVDIADVNRAVQYREEQEDFVRSAED